MLLAGLTGSGGKLAGIGQDFVRARKLIINKI